MVRTLKLPGSSGDFYWEDTSGVTYVLTLREIEELVWYTVAKINSYPERFGKTVENYFDLLFPDEIKNYLVRRDTNRETARRLQV